MGSVLRSRGAKTFVALLLGAALLAAGLSLDYFWSKERNRHFSSARVFPGFRTLDMADSIRIETRARTFTLRRENQTWVLQGAEDFPLRRHRFAEFERLIRQIRFHAKRTADPDKHQFLELGDPAEGGAGTRLTIAGESGILADFILGAGRVSGGRYWRLPEENQTWLVRSMEDIPPLHQQYYWLDLDVFSMPVERAAEMSIYRAGFRPYILGRLDPQSAEFSLIEPEGDWQPRFSTAFSAPAKALSGLRFTRITTRPEVMVAGPFARLDTVSFDGLALSLEFYEHDGVIWVAPEAEAASPDKTQEAEDINARASSWLFAIDRAQVSALIPDLHELADLREAQ